MTVEAVVTHLIGGLDGFGGVAVGEPLSFATDPMPGQT
jgi:hypothetical protein